MVQVEVGEFFAVNYPTLEGGFTAEGENLEAVLDELRNCYPVVAEPSFAQGQGWYVAVYEHLEC